MKKRARIVSGLAALAALFLAPLTEASLTRSSAAERVLAAPEITRASAATAPEPSDFSLFEGTELTPAAAESGRAPRFHPLAAVSLLSKDEADPPLVSADELIYPKTRYRVFGLLGTPILGELRGVSLELRWGSGEFRAGLASGTVGWLSQDPMGDKDSPNLYGFVKMRPHELTDPMGTDVWDDLSTFYDSKAGHVIKAVGKGAAIVAGGALVGIGAVVAAPVIALGLGASAATAGVVGSVTATTVAAGGFGFAAHQTISASISRHEQQLSRGENSPGRALGLGISDAVGATGIAEGLTGLEVDTGRRLGAQEAGDRLGAGIVRGATTALLAGAAARISSSRTQDPEALFARAPIRKGAEQQAFSTAPTGPNGAPICEGCGSSFPNSIVLGSRTVRGYQLDRFTLTVAQRIQIWTQRPVWPTRMDVLDNNNLGIRPLCAPCNLGHGMEGRMGPFATGQNPGLSAIPQIEGANGAVIAIGGGQFAREQP